MSNQASAGNIRRKLHRFFRKPQSSLPTLHRIWSRLDRRAKHRQSRDMSFDLFWALVIFTFVMTFTPGPNTMMLLASGVNFGFRATVPHMTGITLGFGIMTLVVGLGLGEIFKLYPLLYTVLGMPVRPICSSSPGRSQRRSRSVKAGPAASPSHSSRRPPFNGSIQKPGSWR
jgi:hypothetical protein